MGLSALFFVPAFLKLRANETRAEEADIEAIKYGLKEPATLYPIVRPDLCIGTGSCVSVCPEGDVLGLRNGQGFAIMPARCIGHGLCERSCPVDAIELVFGTEKRGVDLPRIQGNFETNVPGIYIIGELGGMGLIRNAFEQGRQCIEGIVSEKGATPDGLLDLVIVGCGPAGLSASLNALHGKMSFVTLERETVGGTVAHYPRKKLVMTAPVKVPGYGRVGSREMLKEELVETWDKIIEDVGLDVRTGETVEAINQRPDGGFDVESTGGTFSAKRVILAIGRRGVPRKLGVEGEDSTNVAYSLREPEAFQGDKVLVVGGGDSAIEAAIAISEEADTQVTLSYRKETFSRIKPKNHERVHEAAATGALVILWKTNVAEIASDSVVLNDGEGEPLTYENDQVLIFAGGVLPTKFLKACGIEIDTKFGTPR